MGATLCVFLDNGCFGHVTYLKLPAQNSIQRTLSCCFVIAITLPQSRNTIMPRDGEAVQDILFFGALSDVMDD